MEFKGTKGKWNHLDKSDLSIWAEVGDKVCELVDKRYLGETLPETWYNAKLISSAPDLLESLDEVVNLFKVRNDLTFEQRMSLDKAQQVIEQALNLNN